MQPLVLIVEDDEISRVVLAQLLERNGLSVIIAEDGPRALAILADRVPQIIITDIMMPGMDGFDFIKAVRSSRALDRVSIIATSTLPDPENHEKAVSLGANEFLPKSYNPEKLYTCISQLLAKQANRASDTPS